MGKCASKQQLHHRELLHQQKYNWTDKSNGRTVNGKNTRSSISEQSIFLLIENEVIQFISSCFVLFNCICLFVLNGVCVCMCNWASGQCISMVSSFFKCVWNYARGALILSTLYLHSISFFVYNLNLITKTVQTELMLIDKWNFFHFLFLSFFLYALFCLNKWIGCMHRWAQTQS